ncbi:RWD domain containing protein [Aphelenchoides avenae]|nr:RWD domain containing protein [Aphelenchus avenae]
MAALSEERRVKQHEELEVLRSIFADDIVSVTLQNCWKQWCPMEVRIHLKPSAEEVHVSLDLDVVCTPLYPDGPPNLQLINSEGIFSEDLKRLREQLMERALSLKGTPVIYDLCLMVQDFLTERNKKPIKNMHEGMLKEKAKEESEQKRKRADSEQREKEEIAEENERRKEALMNRKDEEEHEMRNRMRMLNFGELGESQLIKDLNGKEKRIYKLTQAKLRRPSPHPLATEWSGWDQNQQLLVTEWKFEYTLGRKQGRKTHQPDFSDFEAKLDEFVANAKRTLKTLSKEDQFVYAYDFVDLKKHSVASTNFNCHLLIGQIIEPDDNCLEIPRHFEVVQSDARRLCPRVSSQAVCALRWLHEQNLSHGHLLAHSVWQTKQQTFRLSDYYLLRQVLDLCGHFEVVTNPDGAKASPEALTLRAHQKQDVYCLGSLLDRLAAKTDSQSLTASNPDLVDFVGACQSGKDLDYIAEHKYLAQNFPIPPSGSVSTEKIPGYRSIAESRLTKDFYVVQWLGKGGFGDVYLARNKLDGNDYAVKRIPLNPRSAKLNEKVKREAKLFSKLNHEHVVRYYAAWIETAAAESPSTSSLSSESIVDKRKADASFMPANMRKLETVPEITKAGPSGADNDDDSASFMPVEKNGAEESFAPTPVKPRRIGRLWQNDDSSSIAQSGRMQSVRTLFSPQVGQHSKSAAHSEFDIVFGEDDSDEEDVFVREVEDPSKVKQPSDTEESSTPPIPTQVLYIQMEYCKNSTLRNLIDTEKLHSDTASIWRIFREILLGLQYIHHQNMIHRDIKPMNILLDANWSVKIGDFGLATKDLFAAPETVDADDPVAEHKPHATTKRTSSGLTKDIGTHFYIAPEIQRNTSVSTKYYSAKIDVYSLGIVLFEMFYRPPETVTERYSTLQVLRTSLAFPEDFGADVTQKQKATAKKLISMMLKSHPQERPSVDALLQSEMIPMVQFEEDDFQIMFSQAVRNRKGKLYKWMVDELLKQDVPTALSYCFDQIICLDKSSDRELVIEHLRQELVALFALHAFTPFNAHLLVSMSAETDRLGIAQQTCKMLDSSGLPVALPADLRKNFVRCCVRTGVASMKRFTFAKAYAQTDPYGGVHPVERNECCLDIIGPQTSADTLAAEMLHIVAKIAHCVSSISSLRWTLVLGHLSVVRAACAHLGLNDSSTQKKVLDVLYGFATSNKKLSHDRKSELLANRCELTLQTASSMLKMLEPVNALDDLREQLRPLMRSKQSEVRDLARQACNDIANALATMFALAGEKYESVLFDVGLTYRPSVFADGLVFLMKVDVPHNNATKAAVVLAGGRYDSYLTAERHAQDPVPASPLCAYGFNLPLDNLALIQEIQLAGERS